MKPLPRLRWPMGIIEKLIIGKDDVARAAIIRVRGRTTRRPLSLLHLLECQERETPEQDDASACASSGQDTLDNKEMVPYKTRSGRVVKKPDRL